jgi:hypothetical protein
MASEQKTMAVNFGRRLVFFPNEDGKILAFNYGTNQWSEIPAYSGLSLHSVNDKDSVIGINRFSGNSVDLQSQNATDGVAQDATLETGAVDFNPGGRAVVTGVRPFINGGTKTVRIGKQDDLSDSATYSSSASLFPRTGKADFREESRFHRVEVVISGGFEAAQGVDVEFEPQGFV